MDEGIAKLEFLDIIYFFGGIYAKNCQNKLTRMSELKPRSIFEIVEVKGFKNWNNNELLNRRFKSYLAACHVNGYNSPELLVELEVLTLCNMDLISHGNCSIFNMEIWMLQ